MLSLTVTFTFNLTGIDVSNSRRHLRSNELASEFFGWRALAASSCGMEVKK